MTDLDRELLRLFVEKPPYASILLAGSVSKSLIRIEELENQVTDLQAKIKEIT
jgi:hypothetical protein